ncbi:uncharacterized protein [Diabrotica undecimpunctata]|uniref:uncharacterized protein isoform X1 n=1 Tax=Diabrotica undecimpunctata TaxID=50387 RepID=UPI003B63BBC3
MENLYRSKHQGDKLEIIKLILIMGHNRQYDWLLYICFIFILAFIETHVIAGIIMLYNKTGTWKVLIPYMSTIIAAQPACAGLFLMTKYLSTAHEMADTISRSSTTLPIQDPLFEKYCIKQARNTKICIFLFVMLSLFVHLLFTLPSVFKDYNTHILYWLFEEYYIPPYRALALWMECISGIIESFAIVYPLIFMAYFNFHICCRCRCLSNYIENNFDIRSNHDTYVQNFEYQEMIYTKLKATVEYYLNIRRKV